MCIAKIRPEVYRVRPGSYRVRLEAYIAIATHLQ
jgi:hypothetical protein